jgi:hypothetical protein
VLVGRAGEHASAQKVPAAPGKGQAEAVLAPREEGLRRRTSALFIASSSAISTIQAPISVSQPSLSESENGVSIAHSPPRIASALDLPRPWCPSRISTSSNLQPGRSGRATAPFIQCRPMSARYCSSRSMSACVSSSRDAGAEVVDRASVCRRGLRPSGSTSRQPSGIRPGDCARAASPPHAPPRPPCRTSIAGCRTSRAR